MAMQKNLLGLILGVFLAGCIVGSLITGLYLWRRADDSREELRKRALAAYRDLDEAWKAQRAAQERAGELQKELLRIRDQAVRIENGTRTAAGRAGSLTEQLERAQTECRNIAAGIGTAEGLLAENGKLLKELGTVIQRLQTQGGTGTEPVGTVP